MQIPPVASGEIAYALRQDTNSTLYADQPPRWVFRVVAACFPSRP